MTADGEAVRVRDYSRSSIVPGIQVLNLDLQARSVGIVPPHLHERRRDTRVVLNDGIRCVGLDTDAFVAARMGVDAGVNQLLESLVILAMELAGCSKAIDECAFAARAVSVGEQV